MATVQEIVFDCERARGLARFWAAAVDGYEIRPYVDAEARRLATLGLTPEIVAWALRCTPTTNVTP